MVRVRVRETGKYIFFSFTGGILFQVSILYIFISGKYFFISGSIFFQVSILLLQVSIIWGLG